VATMDEAMDAISSTQPEEDAVFKDEMSTTMAPVDAPVAPAPVIPPTQPVDIGEADAIAFIEDILKDPDNLPYIAGIPAVIVILVLLLVIRRKKAKQSAAGAVAELPETGDFNFDGIDLSDDSDSGFNAADEEDLGAQLEAFAEEAEASDVEEDVISLDDAQPSEDEIPKDDVLAEADVYLAYGIHQQAEELLKTAITANPERDDYKVKLLETYFAAKDKDNFVSRAEEIQPALNPESEEWLRIVAMGREIDATNEMFRHAGELKGFDVDNLIPEKPETDFDLGDAAAGFDLGESIIEDDGFGHGLDDESLDDESTELDLGGLDAGDADNFALNDEGMDELDQELAAAGFDEPESEIELGGSDVSPQEEEVDDLEDGFSLDFEMSDLGLDEAAAEISLEETEVVATAMEPEIEDMSFDLSADAEVDLEIPAEESLDADLDMDLGDLPAELEPEPELEPETDESSDDISLDMGEIDLGGIDLASDESDEVSLDMGDIDLPVDMEGVASEEIGLDLGDIDLAADDDATVIRSTPEEDDEAIDINTLPDDLDEVNTKLDLAKAYIDMGDSDGAASILREVIEEGAGAQKQAAEELLANIA
jgi:pilus assembly protein FimV